MSKTNNAHSEIIPPVPVMNIINAIQRFFLKLSQKMMPPSIWMMSHIENFWLAKGLETALNLDIAGHISKGNNTLEKLASITQTNPDSLYRLLRMLCSHNIFRLSKKGVYMLTPYSRVMLEGDGSVKYLLLSHLGKLHFDLFSEMDYTVRTGINASMKLFNKDIFSHIQDTPALQEHFVKGMSDTSELFAPVLLSSYNFSRYSHLVDVGGGDGSLLCNVLTKYNSLNATLFDNRHIIERSAPNIESYGLKDRISILDGDFFNNVPEGGDLYILKNILHDWGNENCIRILKNIAAVMAPGSKLLIIENIIKPGNSYSYGKMLDILMLLGTPDGRERTLDEFRKVIETSGLSIRRIIPTISPFSLIECTKLK